MKKILIGGGMLIVLAGGGLLAYQQVKSGEWKENVLQNSNIEYIKLTQEGADEIFTEYYKRLYSGSADNLLFATPSLFTKDSWKFLVIEPEERVLVAAMLFNDGGVSNYASTLDEIKNYIPPTEEQRIEFQTKISMKDGQMILPDPNIVNLGPSKQNIVIDKSGKASFSPSKLTSLTSIVDNDTIRYDSLRYDSSLPGRFPIALMRQTDNTWKFDLLLPYQRQWINDPEILDILNKSVADFNVLPVPLSNFLGWLYERTENEKVELMKPFYDSSTPQSKPMPVYEFIKLLHQSKLLVYPSEFEMYADGVTGNKETRIVLKSEEGQWSFSLEPIPADISQ